MGGEFCSKYGMDSANGDHSICRGKESKIRTYILKEHTKSVQNFKPTINALSGDDFIKHNVD